LRTPTELKAVAPGITWVVASGLLPALVPSAATQAVIALMLAAVRGMPNALSRSLAQAVPCAVVITPVGVAVVPTPVPTPDNVDDPVAAMSIAENVVSSPEVETGADAAGAITGRTAVKRASMAPIRAWMSCIDCTTPPFGASCAG
jgi:hypothetical protein